MSDERLNGIIDEAARRMTAEPPAGGDEFRWRVLTRIESGEAPRRTWRAAFVLSPIAISVAVVIAMFVARGDQPDNRAEPFDSAQDRHARPLHQPAGADAPKRTDARASTDARAGTNVIETAPPEPIPAIDPLAVATLAVAPLAVDPLAQESLQIDRLDTITPIIVAPLDIGDAQRRFE